MNIGTLCYYKIHNKSKSIIGTCYHVFLIVACLYFALRVTFMTREGVRYRTASSGSGKYIRYGVKD